MNGTRGSSRAAAWVLAVALLGIASMIGLLLLTPRLGSLAAVSLVVGLAGMGVSTQAARWWIVSRAGGRTAERGRLLIVGAGPVAQHLAREAEELGYEVLGYVEDEDAAARMDWPRGLLGPRDAAAQLSRELRATQLVVADEPARNWVLLEQLQRERLTAELLMVPDGYELALAKPKVGRIGDVALLRLSGQRPDRVYRAAKRVIDVLASLFILLVTGPLLLLAMLLVKLTSPGPALFRQERVGKDGTLFDLVKFRTMVADAERAGPQLCVGLSDPRLTCVGRFLRRTHLDELPQLWNVLRGEMSLVGPRPERPCFVEQFERELPRYSERHRILPGITGLAQVNGYYDSSPREKLRFDLLYLYHPSVWQDVTIVLRTFRRFFEC